MQSSRFLIKSLHERGEGTEDRGDTNDRDIGTSEDGSTGRGVGILGTSSGVALGIRGVVVCRVALEHACDLLLVKVGTREVAVGGLQVEATCNFLKRTKGDPASCQHKKLLGRATWNHSLVEGTADVDTTSHVLEVRQGNHLELVVTLNDETTINGSQKGHGDVGELAVVIEGQVTRVRQVRSGESLELGTLEAQLTGELFERRQGYSRNVLEGDALSSAEVRKLHLKGVVVSGEGDFLAGVLQFVDVEGLQVTVVLDVEDTDGLDRDFQIIQTSVGDTNIAGLGDTLGEVQGLELGESVPLDATDGIELGKFKKSQGRKPLKIEDIANGSKGFSGDRGDVDTLGTLNATSDLLDSRKLERTAVRLINCDITVDGGARIDAVGVALGFDLGVTAVVG